MSKVIPESELIEAKNEILEGLKCINDEVKLLNGYVENLPEELALLESALQTEGGQSITGDITKSVEEIQQVLNKISHSVANADVANDINWTQETHTKLIHKTIMKGEVAYGSN